MKLLLTSAGIINPSIEAALRLLIGKPTLNAKIVFVPTAANPESCGKDWLVEDLKRTSALGWKEFEIVDVAAVANLERSLWWPKFERADVILVGGGNTFYLSYWMQRCGLFDALPRWLETKVYVGISAGSMIVTDSLQVTSHALDKFGSKVRLDEEYEEVGPEGQSSSKTLKLVNLVVRPHLNSPHFPKINKELLQKVAIQISVPLYALDDQSALQIVDERVTAISEGEWRIFKS